MIMDIKRDLKQVVWVGNAKKKLKKFPESVQKDVGDALHFAQRGGLSPMAKPLKGVGSRVFEIRATHKTNTYRAVYAVKIGERIYVLHCFQKKAKKGIETPKKEIDLIKERLKMAKEKEKNYEQES